MEEIKQKIAKVVEELFGIKQEVNVSAAPVNTGADYASNAAMQLAKIVHKPPMVIAEELRDEVSGQLTSFSVEVAAPGFLNFISSDEYFAEQVEKISGGIGEFLSDIISPDEYSGKTVIAEFSDPNPFKVLHVGHLYTSVVGDSISRLLELAGAKVVRANFGGDVGLHVAKTMYVLEKRAAALDEIKITDIAECYVEGTRAYDEDEAAKAEITRLNKEIYRINKEDLHDSELAKLYWRGRELSYQYFEDFYAKIGVKFDKYYPESSVADRGLLEVRAHTGTTYEESDGAVVYKGEKVGLHTRVFINAQGVPTYEAKDVGLIFTKWDDWHFDESIVVTGNEQKDYMRVVLASVSEYAPQLVDRTRHLTHGLVKLPGGVKMSSRKGNFLKAVDVIQIVGEALAETSSEEARSRRLPLQDRAALSRRNSGPSSEELQQAPNQHLITMAALKYAFLKYKMGGDIVFDPQESVSMTGNSGVYLLYSAVRAKKILNSSVITSSDSSSKNSKIFASVSERNLSKKVVQYKEAIREAIQEKAPYKVCAYLYELAQEFSRFYENVKVVGSEREGELAKLVRAYLTVMEHGLNLLGIEVPEEM